MAGLAEIRSVPRADAASLRLPPFLTFCFSISLLITSDAAFAEEADQGAQIAATCASCHDPNKSGEAIPPIDGLDEQAIVKAMHAYRASESPSHVMHAIALSLSEDELAIVARYLAGKDAKEGKP